MIDYVQWYFVTHKQAHFLRWLSHYQCVPAINLDVTFSASVLGSVLWIIRLVVS